MHRRWRDLRRWRRHALVRIAWRDLAGWVELEDTLEELTSFADTAIRAAYEYARRGSGRALWAAALCRGSRAAAGHPRRWASWAARELNFSSDVDLILLFPEHGETDGRRPIANEEFFTQPGTGPDPTAGDSDPRWLRRARRLAACAHSATAVRSSRASRRSKITCHATAATGSVTRTSRRAPSRPPERYAEIQCRRRTSVRLPPLPGLRGVREPARDEGAHRARSGEARARRRCEAWPGRYPRDRIHRPGAAVDSRRHGPAPADSIAAALAGVLTETRVLCPRQSPRTCMPPTCICGGWRTGCRCSAMRRCTACPPIRSRASGSPAPWASGTWTNLRRDLDRHRDLVSRHFRFVVFGGADAERDTVKVDLGRFWDSQAETAALVDSLSGAGFRRAAEAARLLLELRSSALVRAPR